MCVDFSGKRWGGLRYAYGVIVYEFVSKSQFSTSVAMAAVSEDNQQNNPQLIVVWSNETCPCLKLLNASLEGTIDCVYLL